MSTKINRVYTKFLSVIISAAMLFTVFAVIPTTDLGKSYAAGETGQVTATSLNVRSGAGTGYSIIGSLKQGKTFTVIGTANDKQGVRWYKLSYSSKTGYVSSKYVNIKQPTVTPVHNMNGIVNITSGVLNVRSGPGDSYSKIGTLAKGKSFDITGKAQDSSGKWWYTLSYSGKTGFVTSQYVKTKTMASSSTVLTGTTGTVVIDSGVLYVRSGPGTSYSKLGSLKNGKTFNVTGKAKDSSGKWWYVFTYNGKTGYVHSSYVTIKTVTTTAPDTSGGNTSGSTSSGNGSSGSLPEEDVYVNKIGKVSAGGDPLRVRSGAGTSYTSLGLLADGKTFTIIGEEKDSGGKTWYKLTYSGKTGYVYGEYVKVTGTVTEDNDEPQVPENDKVYEAVTFQIGTVEVDDGLNVRTGAGTSYSVLTVLADGTTVTIIGSEKASNGKVWYKYQYSASKVGYICSDYVKVKTVTSNSDFEAYMDKQGFPESYKAGLRVLHAEHPEWVFKAVKLGYNWSDAVTRESKAGINLVSSSAPVRYRNSDTYNSSTKTWKKYDGSWYAANKTVVEHYMDPRNFLNESGIYQFMTHTYDSKSQNADTVAAVIKGSFMQSKNPGGGYTSYAKLINDAGKNSGVNPNVLASMIIQEQGWNGSSLVSGTYSGYAGYYNFFNIGAYTTSTMNAVQRGLWYAKGGDDNSTSYSRPWNTPYKSILGGAQFYSEDYVSNNQDSYYSKKFNVYNGLSKVATHQYMTNVAAAAGEGGIVKKAYASNDNYPIVFEIPVYNNMPASLCPLP